MQFLADIADYQILPYTADDDEYYRELPARVKRQGPQDCRIASSAVLNNYLIVTSNVSDFTGTGARCEDWTNASL
jgi:predicted nucleic acid-binding protein